MTQLSFLDTLDPPPAPTKWTPPPRRKVMTGAYGKDYELEIVGNDPEPFEVEVRGIRALITYSVGFCTYTMDKPGELFWSDTGFRSFGRATTDPDQIRAAIEAYIDAPTKGGSGCGGKLMRWWPIWVLRWCQNRTRDLEWCRDDVWTQWGADKHKECWDRHDREQLAALDRMKAEGIDPDAVISSHRPKQPPVSMIELTTGRAA